MKSEAANRIAKAVRIVELLDEIAARPAWVGGPITAHMVRNQTDDEVWAGITLTGGRPISADTRAAVVAVLEGREAAKTTDIFAGLGVA